MNKLKIMLLVSLLACLLAACQTHGQPTQPPEPENSFYLYFLNHASNTGSAIAAEPYAGGKAPTVRLLVNALLNGPSQEGLASPFPAHTALNSWSLDEGLLTVDLTEHYGDLAGIDLTLADYCLTLTLCQLDRVDRVCITVAGGQLAYRDHDILEPSEVMVQGLLLEERTGALSEKSADAS